MRGTLHFVAAEDLSWLLSLTRPRLMSGAKTRHAALGLTRAVIERARKAAHRALGGGVRHTRAEMYDVFRRANISPENDRGYQLLWALSQTETLCFGPTAGASQTFVLFEEWIQKSRQLDRDEALGELAFRFFRGHGPATLRDFAGWSSLNLAESKIGLAVARASLAEIEVDKTAYFLEQNALDAPRGKSDATYALPAFDEYLIGYKDRSAQVAREHIPKIVPAANGIFISIIVAGGFVVGAWKRVVTRNEIVVTASPFSKLSSKVAAGFEKKIRAYGRFFGMPVTLRP